MGDGPASPPASAQQEGPRGEDPPRMEFGITERYCGRGEGSATRYCGRKEKILPFGDASPCVRGGGTALCAVTEGLQIPAAVQECAYPSLSQPDGCQLPLHKGAKGRGTDVPEKTITPPQTKQPSRIGRAAASLCFSASTRAHIRFRACARERRTQSRGNAGTLPAPAVSPSP